MSGSPHPLEPTSFDHVALWVSRRDEIAGLLCDHLGMHAIDRSERFTLVGADARRGKITLFDAEPPRDPGALNHIALRVRDLEAAVAALPPDVSIERPVAGQAFFDFVEGLRFALVEDPGTDLDYDLDHVLLAVSDPQAALEAFAALGLPASEDRLQVAGKEIRLQAGGAPEGDRPLLNHLAVLVPSAAAVENEVRCMGVEIDSVVDAANTLAVFVSGPDRIRMEYVEHKPSFSLV